MAKEPIASTLFRFVTTRNPQLLSKEERERGFIYFPKAEKANSHYLDALDAEVDTESRIIYLDGRTASFNNLTTRELVENVNPGLCEFSYWLMKNKNTVISEDAAAKKLGVLQLTNSQLVNLWDNLIYQVVTQKSEAVREAIIQMIVADNFIKKDDSATTKTLIADDIDLQRLANAYVVISKDVATNHLGVDVSTWSHNSRDAEILSRDLESFEAKINLEVFKKAEQEIKDNINVNDVDNRSAYEEAYAAFEAAEDTAYANATKVVDPTTTEVSFTNLVLPTLSYSPNSILKNNYLSGKVSAETWNIANEFMTDGVSTEDVLLEKIQTQTKKLTKAYYKGKRKKTKAAFFKGNLIKLDPNRVTLHSYAASARSTVADPSKLMVNLNIATGYEFSKLESSSISITFKDETVVNNVAYTIAESTKNSVVISSYPEEITIPDEVDSLTLSGTVTLDDGDTLDFTTELVIDGKKASGRTGSSKLAQQSYDMVRHGIDRVGVADFRSVEQEICCYVPGEVSRIENILAKEYKERSTRQLLSSETTTERTDETEVENLTDTTTSERSELSSEVSSIINEDSSKNYGASAGVNGSFGLGRNKTEFNAHAYFNGASSSSSSNSNSSSQTYAEEVTTRALERVIQKTTKKRTSRILREFEENNKHGFDNREGTSHVTGVYRWVDKIYTNRLINYGKRLMYQFDVPEPSRFFKEAIIETIPGENPDVISAIPGDLVPPPLPDDISSEISDASLVTRTNYQEEAAKFNAIVEAPPAEVRYVGHAFSYFDKAPDATRNLNERSADHVNLEIPEGYFTSDARANWFDSWDDHINNTKIIVGGLTIGRRNIDVPIAPHTGQIPISFSQLGNLSGNSTVSLKLKLLDAAFEKWQNETHAAILAARQERINEYNDWLYANFEPTLPINEDGTRKNEFNPLLNRALEKRELKRLAIDMMARPFNVQTARNHYNAGSSKYPRLTSSLDNQASYVRFFEQAFDWEIMAYTFYPYFYGSSGEWKSLFLQSNGSDPLFQAFLQSGMARMVVPVRPGFEQAVTYFLETGHIWTGNQLALERDDDLYVSIAEELQSTEGVVEKEWETRVPTALTIVQSDSAPLTENGLPCCHNEDETENLAFGSSIMVGKDETPSV